jgi:hypothetical protein
MGPTHNCWKTVRPRRPTRQKYLARVPCLGAVHPRHRGHAAAGPLHPWVRLTPMCALSSLSSAQARRECQHHFPASTAIVPRFYPSWLCSCTVGCVDLPRRATATTVGDAGAGTDGERLLPAFGELIKVWGVWQFQVLFLLTREDVRQELMMEGCSVEYLARVLVAEAFLLRLCLKVQNAAGVPVLSCRRSSGSGRAPFLFCRTSILRGPAQHALQPPSACLFIIECR